MSVSTGKLDGTRPLSRIQRDKPETAKSLATAQQVRRARTNRESALRLAYRAFEHLYDVDARNRRGQWQYSMGLFRAALSLAAPVPEPEPRGTMECPICGVDSPHAHSPADICRWLEAQASRFGLTVRIFDAAIPKNIVDSFESGEEHFAAWYRDVSSYGYGRLMESSDDAKHKREQGFLSRFGQHGYVAWKAFQLSKNFQTRERIHGDESSGGVDRAVAGNRPDEPGDNAGAVAADYRTCPKCGTRWTGEIEKCPTCEPPAQKDEPEMPDLCCQAKYGKHCGGACTCKICAPDLHEIEAALEAEDAARRDEPTAAELGQQYVKEMAENIRVNVGAEKAARKDELGTIVKLADGGCDEG